MSEVEKALLQALLRLEEAVAALPTAQPKPNLLPLFEEIDRYGARLPADTDPTLLHYLKKRSYQKARLFLQGRESENVTGTCGHV